MRIGDTVPPTPTMADPTATDTPDSPQGRNAKPPDPDRAERDAYGPQGSIRVVLRLWGCTQDDITRAETNARQYHFARLWNVVKVLPSTGTPCPIPWRDPSALKQNALYDAAWAAYPAGIAQ
jgi:hypothetical protein